MIVPNGIDLELHFPIVMGTVPLQQQIQSPDQQIKYIDNRSIDLYSRPKDITIPRVPPIVPEAPPSYVTTSG